MIYERTLGQFDEPMPDGGQPRAAMGEMEGSIPYKPVTMPRAWRMAKAEYTEWFVHDEAVWNRLVANLPTLAFASNATISYNPGNAYTAFFKAQFDAFKAAAGDFGAFIEMIGRIPDNYNLPTWLASANFQWVPDQRPHVPFPFPRGTLRVAPGAYGGIGRAMTWGIACDAPSKLPPSFYFFMGSIPLVTDHAFL